MSYIKNPVRIVVCILLCGFFGAQVFAQSDTVYVSGGPTVYKVSGGSASVILTVTGANFESIAIGSDNVSVDSNGNAAHPFLIYACDTQGNRVIRFDPAAPTPYEPVYSASVTGLVPECGRSTASGDFYVSNKNGTGVYKFANVANMALHSLSPLPPTLVSAGLPATMTGRGLSQKNTGDLLIVDNADNQVLRSPYDSFNPFATEFAFATTNLNSPVGIARTSAGDVFVANSIVLKGKNAAPPVAHFDRSGIAASSCPALSFNSNQTPGYLAATQTDTIYLVTSSTSKATLWSWNAAQGNCDLVAQATVSTAATGIAVGPGAFTPVSEQITAATAPTTFNFNSHAFQISADGCVGTVKPFLISPATVAGIVASAKLGVTAHSAKNLGEAGFEVAYVAKWPDATLSSSACTSIFTDGQFVNHIFGFYDNNVVNNARIIRCDGSASEPFLDATTNCVALDTIGEYPLGGFLPADGGTGVRSTSNSTFVLVNQDLTGTAGQFCGLQSPLVNTTDPKQAASFKSGTKNTLSVKFKLATASGSCSSGPYITDAIALISVAQIAPTFNAKAIASTSVGNADQQPLFNSGNQQYQFTLDVSTFPVGTYSLNVMFLSNNAIMQTIVFNITK
jgi:hypothetical protein